MMEYDGRRVYTDNRIKQAMVKLTFEQKIEFLRRSDTLLERESDIFLDVLSQSRQLLSQMLDKLQNGDGLSDSSDEQSDSAVNLPFNTGTSMGKKLASIAQMFAANLTFSTTNVEQTTEKAEKKAIKNYARAFKKQRASLKNAEEGDVDASSSENIQTTTSTEKELKSQAHESKQYLQTKAYLKENLQGDLENAAKNEQEILLAKMKTQGMQLASEFCRQKYLVSEKLEAAKMQRQAPPRHMAQIEAVNYMIDKNQEMADMYEKDRMEREQALKERLQQRKVKDNDTADEDPANSPRKGSKRKKKRDLLETGTDVPAEVPEQTLQSQREIEPKAETTIESENARPRRRKKARKQDGELEQDPEM